MNFLTKKVDFRVFYYRGKDCSFHIFAFASEQQQMYKNLENLLFLRSH
jgi:hypothetical protein